MNDQQQVIYWDKDDKKYRDYDHPVVRFFALQRIQYIHQWLELRTIKNALDVGCGNGFSTHYLSRYIPEICAIDRSQKMLRQHPMKTSGKIGIADAFKLPFADNSFDLVYGWEVLHHMSDPSLAVAEMARVSRKYVLTAEPNRYNPAQFAFALIHREHQWVLRYTLSYMRCLFESANLKIEHAGSGGWLFPNITPVWLLSLLKNVPYQIPVIGISNWVLGRKPMSLER